LELLPFFRQIFKILIHFVFFLPSLAPFGQAVSEEKIFLTLANQKQELPLVAIFVGGTERNGKTL
jgi:hypothetical protein